jgi:hypothetical protein
MAFNFMKKYYIIGLFLGLTLAVSPVRAETTQEQYNQALMQLITLLQEQVAGLMEQLRIQTAQQVTLTTQVNQIVQNTTPSPVPNIGSPVMPSPVVQTPVTVTPPVPTFFFTKQPVAGIVKKVEGDYIYTGTLDWSQDGWSTNKDAQNQKEVCYLNDDDSQLQSAAALKPGATYTCTLTVVTKYAKDWSTLNSSEIATSSPYSFTVPSN